MQICVRSFQGPLGQTHTHNRPEKQKAWPGVGPAGVRFDVRCAACGLRTADGATAGRPWAAARTRAANPYEIGVCSHTSHVQIERKL